MKSRDGYWLAGVVVSIISLLAAWFVFDMRYMWFVHGFDYAFLRIGFLIGVASMLLSWIFRPSRLFVGLIGMATLSFPPIMRGDKFVGLNAAYAFWVLIFVLLLLTATELHRRASTAPPAI